MMVRDKQALFWNIFFPVMFLLVFGLFSFDQPLQYDIAIFDEAHNDASTGFIAHVEGVEAFTRNTDAADIDTAKALMKEGDLDAVLIIPGEFGTTAPGSNPVPFTIYIDESKQDSAILISVFNQFLDQLTFAQMQTPQLYQLKPEGLLTKETKYLDFLMPGILGMGIMFASVIGVAISVAQAKERKILKRLRATPITARTYLVAEVGARMVTVLMEIALIVLVGLYLFHVNIFGNVWLLALAAVIGSIPFMNLGFFVGGLAKTADTAGAMSNAVTTPMMFLSGVFFSPDMLPGIVEKIVDFLPLTPMLKILRGIAVDGNGFGPYGYEFSIIAGWIVLSFILAWRTFRFEKG